MYPFFTRYMLSCFITLLQMFLRASLTFKSASYLLRLIHESQAKKLLTSFPTLNILLMPIPPSGSLALNTESRVCIFCASGTCSENCKINSLGSVKPSKIGKILVCEPSHLRDLVILAHQCPCSS